MSTKEKNTAFAEYSCFELHLFIKSRDPEYFEKVVKPFVIYKMEKRFVDYYLLDDYEKLSNYANLRCTGELNALEKCLLI
jgi:hypothetical protein